MNKNNSGHVEKFLVVGIINSNEFQKARFIVEKLSNSFPKFYKTPEIRPMLDVEWDEYLTKMKRREKSMWQLEKNVVVFVNGTYVGDDEALVKYTGKKFQFQVYLDWSKIGQCHLVERLNTIMGKFRQLVYMTISINQTIIGTLLFKLYNDLVPLTCENFLNRCTQEKDGYVGTPIHRIMKSSWIQCGGCGLQKNKIPCENYVIPHNRRGVLSMCNEGRHKNNSTQFFITLSPAPWMDYKYVAFGQLLYGNDVLKKIENVPTYFESPKLKIKIAKCGEFTFHDNTNDLRTKDLHAQSLEIIMAMTNESRIKTKMSCFSTRKLKAGAYSLLSDLKTYYWPFMTPIHYLTAKYHSEDGIFVYEKSGANFRNTFIQEYHCLPQEPTSSDMTI